VELYSGGLKAPAPSQEQATLTAKAEAKNKQVPFGNDNKKNKSNDKRNDKSGRSSKQV
jgi:hypothetical protein